MNDDPPKNGESWIRTSAAVAIVIAITSQLGFSIWWAAHLDQSTIHIIERAAQIEAHVTRLDTVGGAKVNELNSRVGALEKVSEAIVSRLEKLESSSAQLLLMEERIKSLQIQASTMMTRLDAISNNLGVLSSRVESDTAFREFLKKQK